MGQTVAGANEQGHRELQKETLVLCGYCWRNFKQSLWLE